MKKRGYIYTITYEPLGYVYVGRTAQNPKKRWAQHVSELSFGYHNNSFLQRDWNIFEEKDFCFSVIEECDIDVLSAREEYWISHYSKKGFCYTRNPRRLLSKGALVLIRKNDNIFSEKRKTVDTSRNAAPERNTT